MTDYQFQRKLRKAKSKQIDKQQKQQLKDIRNNGKQKMETSKKLTIYLIILFTVIIVYSLVAMWHFQDLSHLSTLITAFASEVVTFITYCAKAFFAKKNKELIALQREQFLSTAECDNLIPYTDESQDVI